MRRRDRDDRVFLLVILVISFSYPFVSGKALAAGMCRKKSVTSGRGTN